MKPIYRNDLNSRARELRKNATRQEKHLWYDFLCSYPIRFQRQRPICGFIADFYCAYAHLVVELDGLQHLSDNNSAYDADRSAIFEQHNITVIRFSNNDVDLHFDEVCRVIDAAVHSQIDYSV